MREAESGQPGHGWVSLLWCTRQRAGRGAHRGPPLQPSPTISAPRSRNVARRAAFLCRAYRRWSTPPYTVPPPGQSARGRTRPDS
ncbi:hypothetical protein SGL43_01266 [Streptomyces globisporus]|uniref:Uncharacterized protein n=1 Tax=Streptomyces globisporus TaxID=1908 RepID=A0ABM9GTV2_STRGL|nr:hypothetical protein SGL43_01266 [Streptomyces globisporus]